MSLVSSKPVSRRSPRVRIGLETQVDPHELNQLFVKSGQPARDPEKLRRALDHSLFCVTARLLTGRMLVGFARASGDGIFNAAIRDWVADPTAANPEAIQRQLLERAKQEAKRTMSQCAVSIFAEPEQFAMLRRADFDEEQNGIKAMRLEDDSDLL